MLKPLVLRLAIHGGIRLMFNPIVTTNGPGISRGFPVLLEGRIMESKPIVVDSLVSRAAELDRRYMLWSNKYTEWLDHPGNQKHEESHYAEADELRREADVLWKSFEELRDAPFKHLPVITGD